jgi:hypothetical protein
MSTVLRQEPTAPNLRAEIARHDIEHRLVAEHAGMYNTLLSQYLRGHKSLTPVAAARIASSINELVGHEIFDVETPSQN